MRVRSSISTKAFTSPPPFTTAQEQQQLVSTPYGLIQTSNAAGADGIVNTATGPFDIFSSNVNNAGTFTNNGDNSSVPPNYAVSSQSGAPAAVASSLSGPQLKMILTTTDGVTLSWIFQYNPEEVEFGEVSKYGVYSGVTRTPRVYYSGRDVDRINIRIFMNDRVNGIMTNFQKLRQFATPIGAPHLSTSSTPGSQFQAPPLSFFNMQGMGTYEGYVENPRLAVSLMSPGLIPLQGFATFTFIAIRLYTGVVSGQGNTAGANYAAAPAGFAGVS